jgi:diaminohydroxyphosphoribosylaminopyrimidine deaminase/5-amino-6-(5-phosphoribosylamino)uracil reductase
MDEVIRGQTLSDQQAMQLALKWAKKGWGHVSPNPAVGCCIVDSNNGFLSVGYHQRYGEAHAEVNALKGLTPYQLQGARVFVTLEPCAHYGKTPPCAETLAKLPIKEVIYGILDPNPMVAGKGLELIRNAGIKVTQHKGQEAALESVCEHFLKNMRIHLPFVSIKVATSLDGQMALQNGQSQWITGPGARQEGHLLRATHDALLVGVGTFLADNPSLTIRHPEFPDKSNQVVVIDPNGRGLKNLPLSKLYRDHSPNAITWVTSEKTDPKPFQDLGVRVIQCPLFKKSQQLDLWVLLEKLWLHQIRSVLVEGGAATIGAFLNQKAADRLYLFMAPLIIGSASGLNWSSTLQSIDKLSEAVQLEARKIKNSKVNSGNEIIRSKFGKASRIY